LTKFEAALTKKGFTSVQELNTRITLVRPDGLRVHLDKIKRDNPDKKLLLMLNRIRLTAKPEEVIMAVGMVRGIQIARNYANSWNRDNTENIVNIMKSLLIEKKRIARV